MLNEAKGTYLIDRYVSEMGLNTDETLELRRSHPDQHSKGHSDSVDFLPNGSMLCSRCSDAAAAEVDAGCVVTLVAADRKLD